MSGGVLLCSHSPSLGRPELSLHGGTGLREAGLLEARKDGARVVYAAPRERLAKLMGDTMHILLEH